MELILLEGSPLSTEIPWRVITLLTTTDHRSLTSTKFIRSIAHSHRIFRKWFFNITTFSKWPPFLQIFRPQSYIQVSFLYTSCIPQTSNASLSYFLFVRDTKCLRCSNTMSWERPMSQTLSNELGERRNLGYTSCWGWRRGRGVQSPIH
jgi:hypothetical protein